jgi:hypothetical protein
VALLYAAGQYLNLLERALSVTMSPAADALFPVANLWDGRPTRPGKHGSNGANPTITADLAAFTPAGPATYNVTARAGERRRLNSSGTTSITLQNLATGKYLTSTGAWQVGSVACMSAPGDLNYQVESITLCQAPSVTLKIVVTSGTTVGDWPACNAVVVFGHNLDPGLTVEMRSSTDNFSGSNVLEVTGTIRQPSFMLLDSTPSYNRYVRLALTGTNTSTPWYGEVCPCYLETAVTTLGVDHDVQREEAQIRNEGSFGDAQVYLLSTAPRRVAKFAFNVDSEREREVREELVWRSRGGAYPAIMVPTSSDAEPLVLFGRFGQSWSAIRNFSSIWATDLILTESYVAAPLA